MSIAERPIPGGWSEIEVPIGAYRFRLLTPREPDALLGELAEPLPTSQPHLADPYWAKLWPAATYLAEAVVRGPLSPGTRALELGCGSGLVGLAALACGLEVTFSDYVPLAVELALENAASNGFSKARSLCFDWRSPPNEQFPLILAADVTYDRANLDPLLNAVERMLAPGGAAWFGDAGRSPAEEFVYRALDRGWLVSVYDERHEPVDQPLFGRCQRIVLRCG